MSLRPVTFEHVEILDGFWKDRIRAICRETARVCVEECERTHRIDNFRRAAGLQEGPFEGIYFNDSDVYKVLEGIACVLMTEPDQELEARADEIIDAICAAQQPDGYLYTFYTLNTPQLRWTDMSRHEAYCLGHMIEGALAYRQATGKDKWLAAAIRAVGQMMSVIGPEGRHWVTGHEEIELALVRLYRHTGDRKYLEYAQWLIDERGHGHLSVPRDEFDFFTPEYCQDDKPIRELSRVTGHAVRAMYYYTAAADVASITGDKAMEAALDRIWNSVVPANMYLTGGIGQSAGNEGFTRDWSLPNLTAYCETCAAIGMAFWNQRMGFRKGERRYADLVERELYNGILSGISLRGDTFFYENPLASVGTHHRRRWYGCSCCPTNLIRFIPSVGGYMYSTEDDTIWVNQFIHSDARFDTASGAVGILMETGYPWDGEVSLRLTRAEGAREIRIRIPGWCRSAVVRRNGGEVAWDPEAGYAVMTARAGDIITLSMEMPVRLERADPRVKEDAGRAAVMRGPLVYCAEQTDNQGFDLCPEYFPAEITLDASAGFEARYEKDLLGGVTAITGGGLKLIPYYAWDNREPGAMAVWMKEK